MLYVLFESYVSLLIIFLKTFWNDFPSGRMDKKGFLRYYDEIKDENDKTSVLCEYDDFLYNYIFIFAF
jgi:hypothetical protein